jgi:hypothetical protein
MLRCQNRRNGVAAKDAAVDDDPSPGKSKYFMWVAGRPTGEEQPWRGSADDQRPRWLSRGIEWLQVLAGPAIRPWN